jgi:hypothetical protein
LDANFSARVSDFNLSRVVHLPSASAAHLRDCQGRVGDGLPHSASASRLQPGALLATSSLSLNSPLWAPPEALQGGMEASDAGGAGSGYDGKALDVFSFAIILSEVRG